MNLFSACPIIGCESDNSYIIWLIILGVLITLLLVFLILKVIKNRKK